MTVAASGTARGTPARTPPAPLDHDAPGAIPKARRTLIAAAFVFVVAAAAVTWIEVVERLHAPDPLAVRGRPAAIVWSDRVFRSEAEFAAWLRGRGINYGRWVRSHPAAVTILRSRDRAAAEAQSAASGKRVGAVARKARAGRPERAKPNAPAAQRTPGAERFTPPPDPGLGTPLSIAIIVGALALLVALAATAAPSATSAALTRVIRLRPTPTPSPAAGARGPRRR